MPDHDFVTRLTGHLYRHGRAAGMALRRLCRLPGTTALCLPLLTFGLMADHAAAAPKKVPKPHGFPLSKPPGNVAADDYQELFGGTVWVGFAGGVDDMPEHPRDIIEVNYIGKDGRYAICFFALPGRHVAKGNWRWKVARHHMRDRRTPVLVNGRNIRGNNGGAIMPIYNGRTGGLDWYRMQGKYWFGDSHGHLQKRLPRAVWNACPKFPSAKSLGVGVNEKQTAITYFDLVKQDPGNRIRRPDLVTKNPIEYRNRKTGEWELRGRKRGK